MKLLTALLFAFLVMVSSSFIHTLFSQTNTFKQGFTGTYPSLYVYTGSSQIDWSRYSEELNMNSWQGWLIGDSRKHILDSLDVYGLEGYFQPDTLQWAALGRISIHEAEETNSRFRYNYHRCGTDITDNSQWGNGQWVRYYDKNSLCNEEQSPQGMILSGVNENGEQSFSGIGFDFSPVVGVITNNNR
jgi:hypothetical protein